MGYLLYKLIFWSQFSVGIAPLVIGIFFFSSVQLLFLGILGEYVGSIHTIVQKRPLVVERERVNFEHPPDMPLPPELALVGQPILAAAGFQPARSERAPQK